MKTKKLSLTVKPGLFYSARRLLWFSVTLTSPVRLKFHPIFSRHRRCPKFYFKISSIGNLAKFAYSAGTSRFGNSNEETVRA